MNEQKSITKCCSVVPICLHILFLCKGTTSKGTTNEATENTSSGLYKLNI